MSSVAPDKPSKAYGGTNTCRQVIEAVAFKQSVCLKDVTLRGMEGLMKSTLEPPSFLSRSK